MLTKKRFDLSIYGKVQGVGFLYSEQRKAVLLDIKGYVKNQHDGSVFGAVQAETTPVEYSVKWCHQRPPAADMSRIENNSRSIEEFREFCILY